MNNSPIISLCLPTNGISEWVFPVLNSIFSQGVDTDLFEVVVTDNGDNSEFEREMISYSKNHTNLIYKKTNAYLFYNQIEALKIANGEYLKLVNHRYVFVPGALEKMIQIIKQNMDAKPVLYFSNNSIDGDIHYLNNFDEFVYKLGIFASWTTGVGTWKKKFEEIPSDTKIDKISPHSYILFADRKNTKYVIIDQLFCAEIDTDHSKKGKYDLFKAFSVEEISITQNLYIDGDISANTLKKVIKDYENFVSKLYCDFVLMKKPCSYDLNGFEDAMGIYLNKRKIVFKGYKKYIFKMSKRILKNIKIRK